MSLFLSADRLAEAVGRLQASAARSRLVDYLILRRALVLAAPAGADRATALAGQVILSMRDPNFMQAMYEIAAVPRSPEVDAAAPERLFDLEALAQDVDLGWSGQPYFQVLGTAGETERGYRTRKYRSNGTADTVTKGLFIQKGLVELVPNARPRAITLGPGNVPDVLIAVFMGTAEKPRLYDFAAWWHRSTDVEARFGASASVDDLVEATIQDLGLSAEEVAALFAVREADQPVDIEEPGQE
jgi:hypothetical protein